MGEVLPAIFEKDWHLIAEKLEIVRPFARSVHIDLLDGKFASNTSLLDPAPFEEYSQDFFFELHMMVENPVEYLDAWSKAGFRRFIGQIEMMPDQKAFVAKAQGLGEVGLALDLPTSTRALTVPVSTLDSVLVMTVKAGLSGQVFQESALEKVKELAGKGARLIEVDGGINDQTLPLAHEAGATRCVATSYLFWNEHPAQQFAKLQKLI